MPSPVAPLNLPPILKILSSSIGGRAMAGCTLVMCSSASTARKMVSDSSLVVASQSPPHSRDPPSAARCSVLSPRWSFDADADLCVVSSGGRDAR